jgi:NAD(P)H-hydrate epimerase
MLKARMNGTRIKPITIDQMREVDRLMVEEFGVSINMMMEHASRNIAELSRTTLGGSVKDKDILVLAGKGNNGGDGIGAVRHLTNWGGHVHTVLATPVSDLTEQARVQYRVLAATDSPVSFAQNTTIAELTHLLKSSNLIIDALLGYNLHGNPQEPYASLIELANENDTPVLSVDIPSGLEGTTGTPSTPTIRAQSTLTLTLPKIGLMKQEAKEYVGDLYVADLSVPKQVYERIGIKVPLLFEKSEVVLIS